MKAKVKPRMIIKWILTVIAVLILQPHNNRKWH